MFKEESVYIKITIIVTKGEGGGVGITWDYGINRCTRTIYKKKGKPQGFLKTISLKTVTVICKSS